jgi:hypothetical protein
MADRDTRTAVPVIGLHLQSGFSERSVWAVWKAVWKKRDTPIGGAVGAFPEEGRYLGARPLRGDRVGDEGS